LEGTPPWGLVRNIYWNQPVHLQKFGCQGNPHLKMENGCSCRRLSSLISLHIPVPSNSFSPSFDKESASPLNSLQTCSKNGELKTVKEHLISSNTGLRTNVFNLLLTFIHLITINESPNTCIFQMSLWAASIVVACFISEYLQAINNYPSYCPRITFMPRKTNIYILDQTYPFFPCKRNRIFHSSWKKDAFCRCLQHYERVIIRFFSSKNKK